MTRPIRLMRARSVSSGGLRYRSGDLWLRLPNEEDLAADAAELTKQELQERLKAGQDATGTRHTISPATAARRARNPASKGGTTAFIDTGKLAEGLRARKRGKGAVVEASKDRERAAAELAADGKPVVAIVPEALEEATRRHVEGAFGTGPVAPRGGRKVR